MHSIKQLCCRWLIWHLTTKITIFYTIDVVFHVAITGEDRNFKVDVDTDLVYWFAIECWLSLNEVKNVINSGPLLFSPLVMLLIEAQTLLVQFVVDCLQTWLCNMLTTNLLTKLTTKLVEFEPHRADILVNFSWYPKNEWSYSCQILCTSRLSSLAKWMTHHPKSGVVMVTWSIKIFCLHIISLGVAKASDFKFCTVVGHVMY